MEDYRFVHKDGREGTSVQGTWYAIRLALGPDEAAQLVSSMDNIIWYPIPRNDRDETAKADLIVNGEVLGSFFK